MPNSNNSNATFWVIFKDCDHQTIRAWISAYHFFNTNPLFYRHSCGAKEKSCKQCNRIQMNENTLVYQTSLERLCNGLIADEDPISCKCGMILKSENCYFYHKRSVCKWKVVCQECDKVLSRNGDLPTKADALANHQCNGDKRFCELCHKHHNQDKDCFFSVKKLKKGLPKVCVMTMAITDAKRWKCVPCSQQTYPCDMHKGEKPKSEPNYIYTMR